MSYSGTDIWKSTSEQCKWKVLPLVYQLKLQGSFPRLAIIWWVIGKLILKRQKKRKDLGLYSSEECEGYSMFHLTFIGAEHMTGPGPDPWEPGHVDELHESAATFPVRLSNTISHHKNEYSLIPNLEFGWCKLGSVLEVWRREYADPIITTRMRSNKIYRHPSSIFTLYWQGCQTSFLHTAKDYS